MQWDWTLFFDSIPKVMQGMPNTLLSTAYASLIGLVVGLVLAVIDHARVPVLFWVVRAYIGLIRNTPLMVQLYLAFFGLPALGLNIDPFTCGYLVLGLFTSAYMAGAYRAGIESVPSGQWEAARALNIPPGRLWSRVVIPQALPPVLPALGNWVNATFKLTAYLNVIGVMGIFGYALQVAQLSYKYFEPLTVVGLSYLVISLAATVLIRLLDFVVNRRSVEWSHA